MQDIIYKYTLVDQLQVMFRDEHEVKIELPVYAYILDIQVQADSIVMWVKVPCSHADVMHSKLFYVVGTGGKLRSNRNYLKTIISGSLVYHIFE